MQVVAISNGTVRQRKEKNLASFNRGNGQGAENRICYGKLVIMCIYFDILIDVIVHSLGTSSVYFLNSSLWVPVLESVRTRTSASIL